MQISLIAPSNVTAGAWVVGALEGGQLLPAAMGADKASGGALTRAMKVSRFTGKSGQMLEVLGPQIVGRLYTDGETQATIEIDLPKGNKVKKAELAAHLAFGVKLKSYGFT